MILFEKCAEYLDKLYDFQYEKMTKARDYVSYNSYKHKVKNDVYEIVIDKNNYSISVTDILTFMELSDEEFNRILENEKTYKNISLPEFLYAVNEYCNENKTKCSHLASEPFLKRLEEITSSTKVDIQMINQYNENNDSMLDKIRVNKELEEFILKDMPSEFTTLEKAIYIYIKMCKTFTYDDEYFSVSQKGPLTEKHKDIGYVESITPQNNKVVCFEFDAIYSYFLNKLGINYKNFVLCDKGKSTREFEDEYDNYGDGHMFLKFRCGKYFVEADSVTSVLKSDMTLAKLNQSLGGLWCANINEQTELSFQFIMEDVYKKIAEKEPKIIQNDFLEIESFDEVVSQFLEKTDKFVPLSLEDKFDILLRKLNSTKLEGIDAYSYLLQLKKILFSRWEQKDNFQVHIIRNSRENSSETVAILSTKFPDKDGKFKISRFIYKPGYELVPVSREHIIFKYAVGEMGDIDGLNPLTPKKR